MTTRHQLPRDPSAHPFHQLCSARSFVKDQRLSSRKQRTDRPSSRSRYSPPGREFAQERAGYAATCAGPIMAQRFEDRDDAWTKKFAWARPNGGKHGGRTGVVVARRCEERTGKKLMAARTVATPAPRCIFIVDRRLERSRPHLKRRYDGRGGLPRAKTAAGE